MEKGFSRKSVIVMSVILLFALLITLLLAVFYKSPLPKRFEDTEFQGDSLIRFTEVTDLQTKNLYTLAKVWGFAKYRHPSVTDGTLNWDAELFRVMPHVLDAETTNEANKVIFDWVNQFPFAVPELDAETVQSMKILDEMKLLESDLSWTKDSDTLGSDLSAYLSRLSQVAVVDHSNAYASFAPESYFVTMTAESAYPNMKYDDTGMRLLGLFRYWNIIEYFFPYIDIIDEDWDSVLVAMLPKFIEGQDEQSYILSVAELTTYIHDSHSRVTDTNEVYTNYFGKKRPPVEFMNIDGNIVISAVSSDTTTYTSNLMLGDIVLSMDGVSIADRVSNCKKYISLSNDDRFALRFRYYLFGTQKDSVTMEVLRDGKPLSLDVACYEQKLFLSGQQPSGFISEERIGYINPAALAKGDIDKLMVKFKDTDGIVVDLRRYPSDFIPFTLAEHLIPSPTPFSVWGMCNPLVPGTFISPPPVSSGRSASNTSDDKPVYPNKIVLLMDETSISEAEYTIMSLRNAPDAVVLGSPSIGADGNVVTFMLPGAIETTMTGLSVFYPDGRPTQRVGLEPDIYLTPTIQQIKDGRDVLLDAAIELIST